MSYDHPTRSLTQHAAVPGPGVRTFVTRAPHKASPGPDESILTAAPRRVLHLVRSAPGKTIRELARQLGSSHATATYHLALLVRLGFLTRQRDGRDVRHFCPSSDNREVFVGALLREQKTGPIVQFLASRPQGMSLNAMANAIDCPFGLLKRTLARLEQHGLVRLHRAGFRYTVTVDPDLSGLIQRSAPQGRSALDEPAQALAAPLLLAN